VGRTGTIKQMGVIGALKFCVTDLKWLSHDLARLLCR
jgi:hypothetical protein